MCGKDQPDSPGCGGMETMELRVDSTETLDQGEGGRLSIVTRGHQCAEGLQTFLTRLAVAPDIA